MIILKDLDLEVYGPSDVARVLQRWISGLDQIDQEKEHGIVLVLNVRSRVIVVDEVSVGTLSSALLHPREIFRRAISYGGASIILAHNHPSTVCTPSSEDEVSTQRLVEAGQLLGIPLADHIIFSTSGYYSFCEEGTL